MRGIYGFQVIWGQNIYLLCFFFLIILPIFHPQIRDGRAFIYLCKRILVHQLDTCMCNLRFLDDFGSTSLFFVSCR